MVNPVPATVPFALFAPPVRAQTALRQAMGEIARAPETALLPGLIAAATLPADVRQAAAETARQLVTALRAKPRGAGVEGLVHEYALSSQEGVALMCLAEALLRIPDDATRDALIRDKIADGDWRSHLGGGRSLFVNAATWGLVVTGRLTSPVQEGGLGAALTRLIGRFGEPIIRRGVDMAMRLMGEQFVTGQTIGEALDNAATMEARGFRYSYDMLGEAATTAEDAQRYFDAYMAAVHAIGAHADGAGPYAGPGISIKLSALHPRYARSQVARVMCELLPRLEALALAARAYNIGLNIDAEEADRLDLSLDLLQALAENPALEGWDGLGFVVQAYGKRCPLVIDFIIDLARRTGRRLMVRLVKGAYWDAEIKRAQLDGLAGYPVFTRKLYTDVSYIACARKLLAARDAVFPQFATHNAQTLATIHAMAGPAFQLGDYEFQCLHGMGEPLYEEVVGPDKLDRPCRIYAPVGTHETLLAYLVRRLLENGANSSFVNRISDESILIDELIADPVAEAAAMPVIGAPHSAIPLPVDLLPGRINSRGVDLADEGTLQRLAEAFSEAAGRPVEAMPLLAVGEGVGAFRSVLNPGDHRDIVGQIKEASPEEARQAVAAARQAAADFAGTFADDRATVLELAAGIMERRMPALLALIIREAGKSAANAVAEVREAVDFLRFYAGEVRRGLAKGAGALGPVVCISPWNFPLAIFTGQVAAALATGNPVLAKPAEETPLIAYEAVRILHEAGVPRAALQLLPGDGAVGAALVAAEGVAGVMFTGSTEVARLIVATLADRLLPDGRPVPLVAETGGQNAMIVDSSALAEQVVADVIASAFDSAGQRCSALRILCLQEEIADRTLRMLKGALAELVVGRTDRLATDVGPVISAEARERIEAHVAALEARGLKVTRLPLTDAARHGTFVAPTIIEISRISDVRHEVFGPVLHVLTFRREDMAALVADINATGYGLTFGLHTRLDETIDSVRRQVGAGNVYVNRNIIGAVVGVQPFGGHGLSGTGPKAGGPLALARLTGASWRYDPGLPPGRADGPMAAFIAWLSGRGQAALAETARGLARRLPLQRDIDLSGPVGERNLYQLRPRGRVLLLPMTETGLILQLATALAARNAVIIDLSALGGDLFKGLPVQVAERITYVRGTVPADVDAVLVEGDGARVRAVLGSVQAISSRLVSVQGASSAGLMDGTQAYDPALLVDEVSTSINTAAAGGNASLMTLEVNP